MRVCLFLILSWIFILGACTNGVPKRIFVIHSYEESYEAYPDYDRMIARQFRKEGIRAEISTFYLDCETYNEPREIARMRHLLDSMAAWKPDIILVNEDQATYSLLKTDHDLVKSVPIVFAGVNYPNWPLIRRYPNVTGFHDKIDFCRNVAFASEMRGHSKIVFTILDSTYLDRQLRADAIKQFQGCNIVWGADLVSHDSLDDSREDDPIVFRSISARLRADRTSFLWNLSKFSKIPYLQVKRDFTTINVSAIASNECFTAINESFGYRANLLGGYLTPLETQVKDEVRAAVEILRGKRPQDMPVTESAKEYLLDWHIMENIGWGKEMIPKGCKVIHMPVYIRYPLMCLIAGIGGILLLVALFCLLFFLYHREAKRRKQVLLELEKERESLALAIQGGNTYALRMRGGYLEFEHSFWYAQNMQPRNLTLEEFIAYCHPDYKQIFEKHYLNEAPGKYSVELLCDFNGKGYQWWELRYSNLSFEPGDYKAAGLLLNIQEFKKREQELIEARELAEQAELKQSFLANMSHEIRTPLNAIVGFSNILTTTEELEEEDRKQYIDIINTNSELLLKLINDILELSRIESGYMSFRFEVCAVHELVDEVYSTHTVLMPPQLQFLKEYCDIPMRINVDRGRLTQVLTNFLNNARKFTPQGYIKLGYNYLEETKQVRIYVEDSGKGITKTEQKMIFNRFYKQDEFAQGTGLGLSICKVIIERLNGHIELHSEVGKGSCFAVILPVETAD